MTDKKELKNEELNKVSGGKSYYDICDEFKKVYSIKIDKYETENHINEMLLIDSRLSERFYLGRIISSYEKTTSCGTERTIKMEIKDCYPEGYHGKIIDIGLDGYNCYLSSGNLNNKESLRP